MKTVTNAILLEDMIRNFVRQELLRCYIISGEEIVI